LWIAATTIAEYASMSSVHLHSFNSGSTLRALTTSVVGVVAAKY
jgi:hypothetical protein